MKVNSCIIWRFFKKHPRRMIGAVCLLFVMVAGYVVAPRAGSKIRSLFFSCPIVDITCVDCYSPLLKKKLVAFVRMHMSHVNYLSFNAANFYSSLKDQFDCVTKLTITKRMPTGMHVKINGVRPIMRVNKNYILAADRGVYPLEDFTQWSSMDDLPAVEVAGMRPGMKMTPSAYEGLSKVVQSYYKDFYCTYFNPSSIRVYPRQPRRFAAMWINDEGAVAEYDLEHLDGIVEDAIRRGFCSANMLEKKRRSAELDMRFERRVILRFIDHGRRGRVS